MELNEYQRRAMKTCLPTSDNNAYMLFEMMEELGEIAGKVSKAIRKGKIVFTANQIHYLMPEDEAAVWTESVIKELGDLMWGLAGFAHSMRLPLSSVADMNLEKLMARMTNGTIDGKGDGVTKEERV